MVKFSRGRLAAAAIVPSLAGATLLVGTSLTLAQPAAPSEVPEYAGADELPEIKLSMTESNGPNSDIGLQQVKAFTDYVTAASKGKIQIEVFWSSSLMAFGEAGTGIASGLADMGTVLPLYTPADFPVNNYFN